MEEHIGYIVSSAVIAALYFFDVSFVADISLAFMLGRQISQQRIENILLPPGAFCFES